VKLPSYRHHKGSGQALVEYKGERKYLGRYNSAESKQAYRQFLLEHVVSVEDADVDPVKPPPVAAVRLTYLMLRWLRECRKIYKHNPDELGKCEALVQMLKDWHPVVLAKDFDSLKVKEYRALLLKTRIKDRHGIKRPLTRNYINACVRRLQRMFQFGVAEQLVATDQHQAMLALRQLGQDESIARESEEKEPVPLRDLAATLREAPPIIATMIRVQYYTGMRSGNLCAMASGRIDRSAETWIYRPAKHKTQKKKVKLQIPLGPRVQRLLAPFIDRPADQPLFSPRELVDAKNAAKRACRKTPMTPSQAKRRIKRKPLRAPGLRYSANSYRRAVARAIRKAGVEYWHPHRLRHSHATRVRQRYELEGSQASLGHKNVTATQIYARKNEKLARQIAAEIG
jgi:integrase